MRHNPNSALFNKAYINEKVKFDVQSAFLERPSAYGLLRSLNHMGLTCDPRAPTFVPDEVLQALPPDPEIVELEQRRELLKGGTYRIKGKAEEDEIRSLTTQINNANNRRRNTILEEYRADYFRHRPTQDIEKQNRGEAEEEYADPIVQHQIPERTELEKLICRFPKDLTRQEICERRISTVDLMTALSYKREVPRRYQLQLKPRQEPFVKQESPNPQPFPLLCDKTQCPFCIGDEQKTYEERMSCFCRPSKMMDHVERIHLKGVSAEQTISCRHPVCQSNGLVLSNLMHFKNHVQSIHGISLRE
jgi:hypothetical protein